MRRFLPLFGLLVALVVTFLVYQSGLQGSYLFDDKVNIVENSKLKIDRINPDSLQSAAFSMLPGIAGRPLSMVSFALDYYVQGAEPYGFKRTNLFIHLFNGFLVFILAGLVLGLYQRQYAVELTRERLHWIALAVAAAWLLHPLNLTAVLYIVQRMASLSALFTMLGLIAYLYGRKGQIEGKFGWGWILSSFVLFTPLAVISKENGALLPAFMLLAEVVLLNFQAPTQKSRLALIGLFTITVILPASALAVFSIYDPSWLLAGYTVRDFTLPERLMTEARVLWFYLRLIVVPDIAQLGLHHDDITISRGLLTPYSTLIACAGIVLLAGVALWVRKKQPIFAFGLLFFLLGHSVESSLISLEIAHEHRNYLPNFGILLVLFFYLLSPAWHRDTLKIRQVLAVIFIAFLCLVSAMRASQWADSSVHAQMEVMHHPDSVRANTDAAYMYIGLPIFSGEQLENNYKQALKHYQRAADLSSRDVSGLLGLVGLNSRYGLPVEERWVQELESRLEHRAFAPESANSLMVLEKCLTSGDCTHSPQVMARLLQAALRNPTLRSQALSSVQFAWSNFLFMSMHERDAALEAAYKAQEVLPDDPDTRIILITFLINQGHPEDAKKQIALLRKLDEKKFYGSQLDELEKLATMNKAPQH